MSYQPHPFFRRLFDVYTGDPASIGMQLTRLRDRQDGSDPLLVCTGSDIVLFPGSARPPTVESFRRTTRGFIELAAVCPGIDPSHPRCTGHQYSRTVAR